MSNKAVSNEIIAEQLRRENSYARRKISDAENNWLANLPKEKLIERR